MLNGQPSAQLIPFPMVNRVGKIRDTAWKMVDKPTGKSAAHYRRQVTEAMEIQLAKIGLSDVARDKEISDFWNAVEDEIRRLPEEWSNIPDSTA